MKEILKIILVNVCLLSLTFSPYHSLVKIIIAMDEPLFRRQNIVGITDIVEGTNGIAIADINKDGWMDILTTNTGKSTLGNRGSSTIRMFLNQGNMTFKLHDCFLLETNQFLSANQRDPQIPNLIDFNKDGYLDIFITHQHGGVNNTNAVGNSLYLSQRSFDVFKDVSDTMAIKNIDAYNRQSSIADVNGDGWLDIAVGADNIGNPDQAGKPESKLYLFKPNGSKFMDGSFVDVGGTSLVPGFGGPFSCDHKKEKGGAPGINLVDLDNDGDFDLVQSYHNDMLNTKPDNPCASAHFTFGVFVWKNLLKETGSFKMEPVSDNGLAEWGKISYDPVTQKVTIIQDAVRLPYISFGDINNDNFQDVLAIGPSFLSTQIDLQKTRGKLWINEHHFKFHDVTKDTKVDSLTWTNKEWYAFQGWKEDYPKGSADSRIYGADAVFGDFNNDTFLDFIACDRREPMGTNFKPRNVLYMNQGDGTFKPQPETFSGLDANSICAETADLNNDGLLDLFFAADPENSAGPNQPLERYRDKVFINSGAKGAKENSWLRIRLDGLTDEEIRGARVEFLDQKDMSLICSRIVSSTHSYKSGSPMELHAGLGKANQVMIRVILPSDKEYTFGNIKTKQYLSLHLATNAVKVIYETKPPSENKPSEKKPNIILILTDDLDEKLGTMAYTPKLDKYIKQEGITWEDFFISDTLCCPSRSTIARGQYVHNHGVLTNGLPGGGFDTFYARGNEDSTFATWLQEVGYETGFFGKYLNGYPFKDDPMHIPKGWSTWQSPSAGNPYSDFNYVMNENGKPVSYGSKPEDYLTDVIREHSIDFMKQAKATNKPFLVYLSPYVPHAPATPAPRHESLFPELKTPQIRSFNEEDVSDKASFLNSRKKLTQDYISEMDKHFRKRIQTMQAIDDMVEKVVLTLQELGELDNTYIFFTSDNGFHMGQHRLPAGKGTPYEEDINVPLYVRGPGVPKGKMISGYFAGNTDFASTFAEIAGASVPSFVDGRSLMPIIRGENPTWRQLFFIEFYPFARGRGEKPENLKNVETVLEPLDLDEMLADPISYTYIALRFKSSKYIEFQNGEKEYYDLTKDPYEMDNAIKSLDSKKIHEMSVLAQSLWKAKEGEFRKLEEMGTKGDDPKPKPKPILIELWVGKTSALVDGKPITLDVPPMIKNGRTVVPLRFIAESIQATVNYDSTNGKIVIVLGTTTITLQINNPETTIEEKVNGKITSRKITLESPPFTYQGRTLVPVRFISEVFGLEVQWESKEQKITITNSQEEPKEMIETGLLKESMDLNGTLREYYIYVPSSYTGVKPCPVVFVFHGGGGTAMGVIYETGWDKLAEDMGFIAVFPEGTRKDPTKPANFQSNPQSWNDGSNRKTNEAIIQNIDDSSFVRHMITTLQTKYYIAKNHIHATGFSNGASMSFRVGREVSDLFASIAPVSGSDWLENIEGQYPLSLFYITGTKDPLNPMEGGEIFVGNVSQGVKPPILEMLQKWVKKIEAPPVSVKVSESSALETVKHFPGVKGTEILFTSVKGLGHYWPGGRYQLPQWILGSRENLNAMDATKEICAFFETHPRR